MINRVTMRLRKVLLFRRLYVLARRTIITALQSARVTCLRLPSRRAAPSGDPAGIVVSLTSYPARIDNVWIPIELMLRQHQTPDRVVLVLSEQEFPTGELPLSLIKQQQRGLEILWVPTTLGCHQKLIPTRTAFPDATIVTVDDDCFYKRWVVDRLVDASRKEPGAIIGFRGWEIGFDESGLTPYLTWRRASSHTPSERTFLTGVGAVIYPPGTLQLELLTDLGLLMKLCPTNDDIWYWAIATQTRTQVRCLGLESYQQLRSQRGTPELQMGNRVGGLNDVQLSDTVEHFGFLEGGRS